MLPGLVPPLLLKGASKGALSFRSETSNRVTGVTSITVNTPAGTSVGDIIIACFAQFNQTAVLTPPAGWTILGSSNALAADCYVVMYYAVTSTPPSTFTFTVATATDLAVNLLSFANADALEIGTFNSGTAQAATINSMTPTRDGISLAIIGRTQTTNSVTTPPTGMTLISQSPSGVRPASWIYQNNTIALAGVATGNKTITFANASSRWYGVQVQVEQLP